MELPLMRLIEDLIDEYGINLIQLLFIFLIIPIVIFGSLMNLLESHLPNCIRQSFRYGKHSHRGPPDVIVSRLEIPKSWFKHFYVFAFVWSLLALALIIVSIARQAEAPEYVLRFLDFLCGGRSNRVVQVNSNTALIGTILLTLQCTRRFYETNYLQIFSKKSKINLSHYIVGFAHYFGAVVSLLSNTEGFVRNSRPSEFSLEKFSLFKWSLIIAFLFAFREQYRSNMILVNVRKDPRTGAVRTEQHFMPSGGWFERVSSPHMLFEVIMYYCLGNLFSPIITWQLIFVWVLCNQTCNALLTHQWYRENFRNYPKQRIAIFPHIL